MERRQRRQIKTPKRFEDAEVYWDLSLREPEQTRSVYRLLKRKDIRPGLRNKEVHLFWPEDRVWYKCIASEVDWKRRMLYVHYCDEDSYEEINAAEVIREGHIAVVELRPLDAPLHKGEIPVDEADRANVVYVSSEESSDSKDSMDSEERARFKRKQQQQQHDSDDSDEELMVRAARAKQREGHKQVKRPSKRGPDSAPQNSDAAAKKPRLESHAGAGDAAGDEEIGSPDADPFKKAMVGAVMHTLGDGKPAEGSGDRRGSAKPVAAHAQHRQTPARTQPKVQPHVAHSDMELRRRARDQLTAALQVAADELHREGIEEDKIAKPGEVGLAVEVALFQAHGGLSKEYKTKFRSLVFNLKDANNPDLRARVLQGELAPDALVLLSTAELASRQLSAWRQQKEEEFAKAKFLDDEAASKFSTAAAALLKSQRHSEMQKVNDKLINTQEALMGSGANARDDTQEGAQARAAAAAAAAAAGEAHPSDLLSPSNARPAAAMGGLPGGASAEAGTAGGQSDGEGPSGGADAMHGNGLSSGIRETLGPSGNNSTELTTTVMRGHTTRMAPMRHSAPDLDDGLPSNDGEPEYDPTAFDDPYMVGGDDEVGGLGPAADAAAAPTEEAAALAAAEETGGGGVGGEEGRSAGQAGVAGAVGIDATHGAKQHHHPQHHVSPAHHHRPPHHPAHQHTHPSQHHHHHYPHHHQREVEDLLPLVGRPEELGMRAPKLVPGDMVWQGNLVSPDVAGLVIALAHLGGAGDLATLMGPPHATLEVKGTVNLGKVEQFLNELRMRSRSRTITLGLARNAGGPDGAAALSQLLELYSQKGRSGVFHPYEGLDCYVLPPSRLAQRLLKTARLVAPPQTVHLLPPDVPPKELLLAMVYRRDWAPPPSSFAHQTRQPPFFHPSSHSHPSAAAVAAGVGVAPPPARPFNAPPSPPKLLRANDPRQALLMARARQPVPAPASQTALPSATIPTPHPSLPQHPPLAAPAAVAAPAAAPAAPGLPPPSPSLLPSSVATAAHAAPAPAAAPAAPNLHSLLQRLAPSLQHPPPPPPPPPQPHQQNFPQHTSPTAALPQLPSPASAQNPQQQIPVPQSPPFVGLPASQQQQQQQQQQHGQSTDTAAAAAAAAAGPLSPEMLANLARSLQGNLPRDPREGARAAAAAAATPAGITSQQPNFPPPPHQQQQQHVQLTPPPHTPPYPQPPSQLQQPQQQPVVVSLPMGDVSTSATMPLPVPATSLPLLHPTAAGPPASSAPSPPTGMAVPGMLGIPPPAAVPQLPPQIVVMQPDGTFRTVLAPGPEGQQGGPRPPMLVLQSDGSVVDPSSGNPQPLPPGLFPSGSQQALSPASGGGSAAAGGAGGAGAGGSTGAMPARGSGPPSLPSAAPGYAPPPWAQGESWPAAAPPRSATGPPLGPAAAYMGMPGFRPMGHPMFGPGGVPPFMPPFLQPPFGRPDFQGPPLGWGHQPPPPPPRGRGRGSGGHFEGTGRGGSGGHHPQGQGHFEGVGHGGNGGHHPQGQGHFEGVGRGGNGGHHPQGQGHFEGDGGGGDGGSQPQGQGVVSPQKESSPTPPPPPPPPSPPPQ